MAFMRPATATSGPPGGRNGSDRTSVTGPSQYAPIFPASPCGWGGSWGWVGSAIGTSRAHEECEALGGSSCSREGVPLANGIAGLRRSVIAVTLGSALLACACLSSNLTPWRGRIAAPWSSRLEDGDLEVKTQAECDGDGCGCDCSWASVDKCRKDDHGRCFQKCCSKARTCKDRGGCSCDCSWASQEACRQDDGGCCFTCCCGEEYKGAGGPQCARTNMTEEDEALPPHYEPGSIYCFSLMRPTGYERHLVAWQYRERTSIFACDEAAVYSNRVIKIVGKLYTVIVDSDLQCKKGGEFFTALNNEIFLAVWRKVISDGHFLLHNWTVKVDPDTVFLPWRLRSLLTHHPAGIKGRYINNCKYGLHGPLEVFSTGAILAWGDGMDRCVKFFTKQCNGDCWWGEDMFIDQCLCKVLGVKRDNDIGLLSEDHCDPPEGWDSCEDASRVAFHPFKKQEDYTRCLDHANKEGPPPSTTTATSTRTTTITTTTRRTSASTSTVTIADMTSSEQMLENPLSFDCDTENSHWEYEWSAVKRTWCCIHLNLGCKESSPTGPTAEDLDPSVAHDPDVSSEQVGASHGKGGGECSAKCPWNGEGLGCRDFIAAVIGHPITGAEDMCLAAMGILLEKCPACETCTPADLGCDPPVTTTPTIVALGQAAPTSTVAAGSDWTTGAWTSAPVTTAMFFDCTNGAMNWQKLWSFEKMTWCCQHERVGCITTSPTPYLNCLAQGLSDEQKVWCCRYKNTGCTPSLLSWFEK